MPIFSAKLNLHLMIAIYLNESMSCFVERGIWLCWILGMLLI